MNTLMPASPPISSDQPHAKLYDAFALAALLALPFGLLLEVGFIGQIYANELLFILILPFLLLTSDSVSPAVRRILWWIGVWFVVLFATDIYRGSFIGDYLRGWAKLIFFAIDIYVLARLLTTERRVLVWFLGANIALAIFVWKEFDEFAVQWKYGVGLSAVGALATLALLMWPQRKIAVARIVALACIAVGTASLFLNARNTFLTLSLSGILLGLASFPLLRRGLTNLWDRSSILLLLGACATAYLAGTIYVEGAREGIFGDDARSKLQAQQNDAYGPVLGILAGGRSEFNASFPAIKDSPLVGYGSSARSAYYYNIYVEQIREYGTPDQVREVESKVYFGDPPIPTHSHIFGAWVEAGIIGAAFWLMILSRIVRATRDALELRSSLDVLILLTVTAFIWDIFFSPFGGEVRLQNAALIVLLLFFGDRWRPADRSNGPEHARNR